MCSYNFIDGVQSCSNHHFLVEVLKGELNFQGFVQSDWWAVLYPSFMEGLDQERNESDGLEDDRDSFKVGKCHGISMEFVHSWCILELFASRRRCRARRGTSS